MQGIYSTFDPPINWHNPPLFQTQQYAQYPQQAGYAQQHTSNNVVVVQQTAAAVPVVVRPDGYQPDAGQGALVFAMIITIIALIFGCWWSIVCSIPGIVFASSVRDHAFLSFVHLYILICRLRVLVSVAIVMVSVQTTTSPTGALLVLLLEPLWVWWLLWGWCLDYLLEAAPAIIATTTATTEERAGRTVITI